MKTLKSFNSLNTLGTIDKIKLFRSETKIKVQLTSGGRLWFPNLPNGSIEQELLKHKVGRSMVKRIERVEVAMR